MNKRNNPFLLIHPPIVLSLLAATALVLATLEWLYSFMTRPRESLPAAIGSDFAMRFAVKQPFQAVSRVSPRRPSL